MKGLKYYSFREYSLRLLWCCAKPFFRISPRHLWFLRVSMLRVFGAKIGKNVRIYPSANISQPWNLEIGDDSTISWSVILYCLGQIRIGSGTIVSQYSSLCAGSHDYTHPSFLLQKEDINISDNVWIASNAFIGPGVVVGSGSVVGACSVVFRNVPPSVLCVGNPSKIIKRLK